MTGLIDAVIAAGHQVLVIQPGPLSTEQPVGYRILEVPTRHGLGLAAAKVFSRAPLRTARITSAGRRTVTSEIASFDPDLTIVSELHSWPVASRLIPAGPWIYDAHNIESEMFAGLAAGASGLFDRATFGIDRRRVARQERDVVARAEVVVAVSREDAVELERVGNLRRPPVVVPSSVPEPPKGRAPVVEPRLLYVGTLDYPPNADAVVELVTRILPGVREVVPAVTLQIVGRKPTAGIRALATATPGVDLAVGPPDLEPYYLAARCCVLPIRSGGGSRLKVYEALAHGVPVIGTRQTFAGIELCADAALIAESEAELVAATVRLLTDDDQAVGIGHAGRACFRRHLSWEHAAEPLLRVIDELT